MKETKMFTCLLCKKLRAYEQLELLFNDGSPMCKICGDDIRRGFSYYDEGKEISYKEFKERINKEE